MSHLITSRQCEEMSSDEELQAFYESQAEARSIYQDEPPQLASSDVMKIEQGLQIQSIYHKLQSEQNQFVRQILIKCLANLLDKDLISRQKSWTKSDREKWYELQQEPQLVEAEFNPF